MLKYIHNQFLFGDSKIDLNPSIILVICKPDNHPQHSSHCDHFRVHRQEAQYNVCPHLPLERVVGEVLVVRTEPPDTGSMLSMWFLGGDNITSLIPCHITSRCRWLPVFLMLKNCRVEKLQSSIKFQERIGRDVRGMVEQSYI